jgi:hypothetical protein
MSGAAASADSPQAQLPLPSRLTHGLKAAAIVFALLSRWWALPGKNRLLVRAGGADAEIVGIAATCPCRRRSRRNPEAGFQFFMTEGTNRAHAA